MNTARTNHFGRRLISLLLAVMLIASLCVSGIGSFSAVTVNKAATGEDQVVYKLVDTITVGNEYLIVNTNEAGDAFALKNNGGTSGGTSMAAESVKILSADIDADSTADLFIADAAEDIVWQTTENGEGFNLTNGTDYLEGKSGSIKIYDAQQNAIRSWKYTDSKFQFNNSSTYNLYYSSSRGFAAGTSRNLYVFEKTTVSGEIVIPTSSTL